MTSGAARKGFDLDLRDAVAVENKLLDIIQSGNGLVEVKSDQMARATGNVFVEFEYRGQPSGITSTEAGWWAIEVQDDVFVLMPTEKLRAIAQKHRVITGGDNDWSKGRLVPTRKLIGVPE